MQTRRLAGASALGILVAVALSGCMKMDMQLDLQSDNTVDGSLTFAISSEMADLIGESPESLVEEMQQDSIELEGAESVRTEPYDDGEYIGTTTYFEGQSIEALGTPDDAEGLTVVREGDDFVLTGVMDMSEGAEDMGMFGGDGFDMRIAVTFPGAVSSHDGTLEGTTVIWTPVLGERTEMNARGSAVGGGTSGLPFSIPVLLAFGAAILLLIGLVLFFVLRSRKSGGPAPATAYPTGDGTAPATAYPAGTEQQAGPGYAPQAAAPQAAPAPPPPPPPAPAAEQAPPPPPPPAPKE